MVIKITDMKVNKSLGVDGIPPKLLLEFVKQMVSGSFGWFSC